MTFSNAKGDLPGFSRLGEILLTRAGASLRELNDDFAGRYDQKFRLGDLEGAIELVRAEHQSLRLDPWEPLLEAFLDVQLSLTQVRASLRLLRLQPDERSLRSVSLSAGGWVHYHTSAWSLLLDGFLERARTLVCRTVRALVRPSNTEWRHVEAQLLLPLDGLLTKLGPVRNPVAHGGGAITAVGTDGLIAGAALSGVWIDVDGILDAQEGRQDRWHQLLLQSSSIAVDTVDGAFQVLANRLSG